MNRTVEIRFSRRCPRYRAFSNFSRHAIVVHGVRWPTVEHFYQAQKFLAHEYGELDPRAYLLEGITSLAMPRIASGLGGLEWRDVKRLIREILGPLTIPVLVYEEFTPESEAIE
jgi:predicted NAD-dependent protein-ADP-ribosyltransferase YbiA (DUF1768 family)